MRGSCIFRRLSFRNSSHCSEIPGTGGVGGGRDGEFWGGNSHGDTGIQYSTGHLKVGWSSNLTEIYGGGEVKSMSARVALILVLASVAAFLWPAPLHARHCTEPQPKHDPTKTLVTWEAFGDAQPCEVTPSTTPGSPIINLNAIDGLATDAQWISFEQNVYHTNDEGLYRFVRVENGVKQIRNVIRIEDKDFKTIESRLELFSGLSKLHIHGNSNNQKTGDTPPNDSTYIKSLKIEVMSKGFVATECGYIAGLGVQLLRDNLNDQSNQNVRCVHVEADASLNLTYDKGHQLLEVRDPITKKMVLVDLDLGYVFYTCGTNSEHCSIENMHFLSPTEFWEAAHKNRKPGFLALSKGEVDPMYTDYPWLGWRLWTEYDKWGWYRQVFSGGRPRENPDTSYCWQGTQ